MRELIEQLKFPDQLPDEYNYKKADLILFNGFTSAIQALNRMDFGRARQILMIAQQDAEDAYISAADESREEGQAQEEIQIDA